MKNLNFAGTLLALVAARGRTRPVAAPARLPEWRALQRRVIAARLGGGSGPVQAARAPFDDVQ